MKSIGKDVKSFIYICAKDKVSQRKAQQELLNKGYVWMTSPKTEVNENCILPDKFVAYFADKLENCITYCSNDDLNYIIDYVKSYNCKNVRFIGFTGFCLMETE